MTDKTTEKDGLDEKEIINGELLKDKIYVIRGRQVMLDYDLAKIYGYTTKMFNRQVARNIKKFEGEDFMFQLTRQEIESLSRCQNGTTINQNDDLSMSQNVTSIFMQAKGIKGGRVYLPYAFTEQGVYMLMTVLRGELAVKQSRALVMTFKVMKDYVLESQERIDSRDNLKLMMRIIDNTRDLEKVKHELEEVDKEIVDIHGKLSDTVKRSELSPIVFDFSKMTEREELFLMKGNLMEANEIYTDLYSRANKSIYIIDNYVGTKTLKHLCNAKLGVDVVIFSDNLRKYLNVEDLGDFKKERSDIKIRLIRVEGMVHDRFIVLDYGSKDEQFYHVGGSEKDAGKRMSAIMRFDGELVKKSLHKMVDGLLKNGELGLR